MNRNRKIEAAISLLRRSEVVKPQTMGRLGGLLHSHQDRKAWQPISETRKIAQQQRRAEYLREVGRMEP